MNKVGRAIIKQCLSGNANLFKYIKNKVFGCNYAHILVTAMMKSGGTYLAETLGSLPNYRKVSLVHAYGRREQELCALKLMSLRHNYAAHHHVRFSDTTETFINAFCLKPVVLVRNIFDIVVSMKDYIRKGHIINQMVYILPEMTGWQNSKIEQFRDVFNICDPNGIISSASSDRFANDEVLEEFLIDMFIPWYFHFYLSWCDCKNKIIVTYEEMNKNMFATIRKIADYHSLRVSDMDIQGAIEAAKERDTRKNQGIVGRGKDLSNRLKEKVEKMAAYYRGRDLSPMGLPGDLQD